MNHRRLFLAKHVPRLKIEEESFVPVSLSLETRIGLCVCIKRYSTRDIEARRQR